MLVLAHPALSNAAAGFSDGAARNVPQDGVLALFGLLVDASWVARLVILGAGLAAGFGSWWLVAELRRRAGLTPSAWAIAAAMTVALWNPFVVERLLQGHWSLVVAVWCTPVIAAAALARKPLIVCTGVFVASLTPTGALLAVAVAVVMAASWRDRAIFAGFGAWVSLPWLLPGLLRPETGLALPASASVFAPRAETYAGTLGSLVGLGGIWNSEAVPASRQAGFALFGIVLFAVLLTGWFKLQRGLKILLCLGLGAAIISWLGDFFIGWLVSTVPGTGIIRDGHKLLGLALPAYIGLAGLIDRWLPVAAITLALLQVPDAPRELSALRPVQLNMDKALIERADGRDILFPDGTDLNYRDDGAVILNPYTKAASVLTSGQLTVDGVATDRPTPRWVAAQDAWKAGDLSRLARLDVGLVVAGDGSVVDTGAETSSLHPGWILPGMWLATGLGTVVLGALRRPNALRKPS